ncbi:undecaprenyl-phosphate glucose phosphotransferase [Fontimonas sp. SYSU GA230001]|uniref:undecaprenyl-phosphate glucose phosphotransferase n=1 Tax=Fontimonas sp. SYSU GA230001 TaxID=3142450 RepID=UPI0032B57758
MPGATAKAGRAAFVIQGLLYAAVVVAILQLTMRAYGVPNAAPYPLLTLLAGVFAFGLLGRIDLLAAWRVGKPGSEGTQLLYRWMSLVGLLLFVAYVAKFSEIISRVVLLAWAVMTPAALIVLNIVARGFARRYVPHTVVRRSAVVLNISGSVRPLIDVLRASERYELHGYFDERGTVRDGQHPAGAQRLGAVSAIKGYVAQHGIEVVFIMLPRSGAERVIEIMDELGDTTASVYVVPDLALDEFVGSELSLVEGVPMLRIAETPLFGVHGLYKHVFDFISALIGLILLSPMLAAIAVAVRLDSPGPILYRQKRYGLNGQAFDVFKFRTMRINDPEDRIVQVSRDDPRVTRVGRILRRTSLDELPQLVNVLRGDMSLVGPRPHAVQHNEFYRKAIRHYMLRHKVKPGLTGWAQINGLRGPSAELATMEARVKYDLYYIRHWSPAFDLQILFRTLVMVLRDRNAF